MYAKKCDRCGAFYVNETPKVIKIKDTVSHGISWQLSHNTSYIDLCPDCLNSFKKWFERN